MQLSRRRFLEVIAASGASGVVNAKSLYKEPTPSSQLNQNSIADKGWTPRVNIRQPNIVIAVLDDVGFADLSCFGSDYEMPFSESMAKNGTRFNKFHVTAVCAPTRA